MASRLDPSTPVRESVILGPDVPATLPFSRFRAVLFDIDGTLMDSTQQCIRGLSDTYAQFGVDRPSDAAIAATIGTPLTVQLTMFGLGETDPATLQERIDYAIGRYGEYENLVGEHLGAMEALEIAWRYGKKTALVTSKNAQEMERFDRYFRGRSWVHAVVCASDVAKPKPDPESAQLACRRLGVEPEEAVMIGDSIYDIRCARDAGVATVAVSYGATPYETLAAERPDLLFQTPEELRDWVAQPELMTYAQKEISPCRT